MDEVPGIAETLDTLLAQLKKDALEGAFDRVEEAWLRAMESPQQVALHLEAFLEVAERFVGDARKQDRLGTLLELLLGTVDDGTAVRPVLRVYWLLLYCFPEKREYLTSFCERYEQLYPLASPERAFYEACNLSASLDPLASLRRLENLLKFSQGAYVYHRSGWGVGRVVAVDPFLKQVKVDLEAKRQHRIAIDVVDTILDPLAPDSFHALRFEGGAELRRLRDEDPIRLMDLVFGAFGSSLPLKDVKAKLVPDVIASDSWIRWWNRVKDLLRETGLYRVGDRAPHLVEKLDKAVSYEDELLTQYGRAGSWQAARQCARQISRRPSSQAWARVREDLHRIAGQSEPAVALEAALILAKTEGGAELATLKECFSRFSLEEVLRALDGLPGADDQRRAAESLPLVRPADWEEIASQVFQGKKDTLREAVLDVMERQAPERIDSLVRELVKSPKSGPDAFTHLLALHVEGAERPALAAFREKNARDLLVLVLDLLEHMHHKGAHHRRGAMKTCMTRIQDILTNEGCRVFRRGVEAMDPIDRQEIHGRLVRNEGIAPHEKGALLDALADYEPEMDRLLKQQLLLDEKTIHVSAEGLVRKQAEFRDLMEVKLPKNFEDIGRARAFGDLSENAEYTAALEERDKLTKRATQMRADLDRAKVIDPAAVTEGVVGLGSSVRLRNVRTGEEVAYGILGPWDGGPESGVLNYQSPLGRLLLGKAVGHVVEARLPGGTETYEILESTTHFKPRA